VGRLEVRFSPIDLRLNSHLLAAALNPKFTRLAPQNLQISPSMKLVIFVSVIASLALHANAANTVCTRDMNSLNEQEHPWIYTSFYENWRGSWGGTLRKDVDIKSYLTKVKASSLQTCFQKCVDMNDLHHGELGECWTFSYQRATKNCYMSQRMDQPGDYEGPPDLSYQALCPKKGFVAGFISDD
jgi:hypothetical protein